MEARRLQSATFPRWIEGLSFKDQGLALSALDTDSGEGPHHPHHCFRSQQYRSGQGWRSASSAGALPPHGSRQRRPQQACGGRLPAPAWQRPRQRPPWLAVQHRGRLLSRPPRPLPRPWLRRERAPAPQNEPALPRARAGAESVDGRVSAAPPRRGMQGAEDHAPAVLPSFSSRCRPPKPLEIRQMMLSSFPEHLAVHNKPQPGLPLRAPRPFLLDLVAFVMLRGLSPALSSAIHSWPPAA